MAENREENITALLMHMNDVIESNGHLLNNSYWDFNNGSTELTDVCRATRLSGEDIQAAVNTCISREFVDQKVFGAGRFGGLVLTKKGQARAISAKLGKDKPPPSTTGGTNIGKLYVQGPAQVGNGNTMNIEHVVQSFIQRIDDAEAAPERKEEAKGILRRFLEHPLVSAITGASAGALMKGGG